MGVTLRNLVLKLRSPEAEVTMACDAIRIRTASDDWRSLLQVSLSSPPLRSPPPPLSSPSLSLLPSPH